jgi:hypothetical protein
VLPVKEIGKVQPLGRICYITRILTFIWNADFTNVRSAYPKSRETWYFSEELYAPKLPNVQHIQINSLGYSKKDYVGFWDKNEGKLLQEGTNVWKLFSERLRPHENRMSVFQGKSSRMILG